MAQLKRSKQAVAAIAWPYPIRYGVENEVSADVLVLGSGIAGCWAAISAARKGLKVTICMSSAKVGQLGLEN